MITREAHIRITVQQSDQLRSSAPQCQSFTPRGESCHLQHSEWAKGIWVWVQQHLVQSSPPLHISDPLLLLDCSIQIGSPRFWKVTVSSETYKRRVNRMTRSLATCSQGHGCYSSSSAFTTLWALTFSWHSCWPKWLAWWIDLCCPTWGPSHVTWWMACGIYCP